MKKTYRFSFDYCYCCRRPACRLPRRRRRALGATRVIYPQGSKQTSLPIINSSASNVFLIQSWVANADGSRSTDFIITPPLFVIQPKKENILRIMYVGPSLPTDRESVFYLNSKAIPSVDKNKLTGNSCKLRRKA